MFVHILFTSKVYNQIKLQSFERYNMSNTNKEINCAPSCKKTSIGGQALMEGIMMRGPEKSAMAVRNAKGNIILETSENPKPPKVSKVPFLRGIFNMVSSLKIGYKYLMRSADIAIADAEEADREAKEAQKEKEQPVTEVVETPVQEEIKEEPTEEKEEKKTSIATSVIMVLGVVFGVIIAVGLFIALPATLYSLLDMAVPADLTQKTIGMSIFRSAFEAVFKIILLVLYMLAVSRMKEIRRVFMYHGAEHKTIFCYEAGLPLTVDNIRSQRRFHPRCGTSFLILVLLVSLFLGIFIPASLALWIRILLKIALLPLTIGIGYELIKLAGKKDNAFTRFISAPGVWLQHITTVEPDDSMIECAIAAMNEVIPEDKTKDNW